MWSVNQWKGYIDNIRLVRSILSLYMYIVLVFKIFIRGSIMYSVWSINHGHERGTLVV